MALTCANRETGSHRGLTIWLLQEGADIFYSKQLVSREKKAVALTHRNYLPLCSRLLAVARGDRGKCQAFLLFFFFYDFFSQ